MHRAYLILTLSLHIPFLWRERIVGLRTVDPMAQPGNQRVKIHGNHDPLSNDQSPHPTYTSYASLTYELTYELRMPICSVRHFKITSLARDINFHLNGRIRQAKFKYAEVF